MSCYQCYVLALTHPVWFFGFCFLDLARGRVLIFFLICVQNTLEHLYILNRVDKTNLHLLQEMQIGKRIERLKKGKAKDSQSKVKVENMP